MVEQWKDIPAYEGLYQVSDAAEFAVATPEEPAP